MLLNCKLHSTHLHLPVIVFFFLILLLVYSNPIASAGEPAMANVHEVSAEMVPVLLERLQDNQKVDQKWLYAALTGPQMTLRAYAATALGKAGDQGAISYLIQALSDQSAHVGAKYVEPGMATTRYRANQSLKALTGKDFGFVWNAPESERKLAIQKWIAWDKTRDRQAHSGTASKDAVSELDAISAAAKSQAKEAAKYQGFIYKTSKVPKEWLVIVWYVTGHFPDGKPKLMPGGFSAVHVSDTTGEVLKIVPGW